jgi:uncharacterized repeat protein (TIGR04076 family)
MSENQATDRREFMKTSLLCGAATGTAIAFGALEVSASETKKDEQTPANAPKPLLKIKVLRLTYNEDLAKQYCQGEAGKCPIFKEGQEFHYLPFGGKPEKFCPWAWDDISRFILALEHGATFKGWMQNDGQLISCCTDGIRPVVFSIEKA